MFFRLDRAVAPHSSTHAPDRRSSRTEYSVAVSIASRLRQPFSGMSHALGAVLSAIGLVILLIAAHGRPWHVVSFAIYGATMIVLYAASALYHSLDVGPDALRRLNKLDHMAIFLLIAGTYTPLCLVTLRGAWGWSIFGTVWGLATVGMAAMMLWRGCPHWVRVTIYVLMGWIAVIALRPISAALPPAGLWWLFAGGFAYTGGVVFYATEWPKRWPNVFDGHDLWHLFVMAGSACHYVLVLRFIGAAP
ncbi:MAG: hemolysin III family protein [Chthonomonadales bacterium]|nr:hemolysin III family protein [Chthonomonadales bacterium]